MKIWALMIAALVLAGCVTESQKKVMYGMQRPATAAERRAIVTYVRSTFFDPYSMRDVSISDVLDPAKQATVGICVKANAKNRMGAYTGLRATSYLLVGGRVTRSFTDDDSCLDPRLHYSPFPELENIS